MEFFEGFTNRRGTYVRYVGDAWFGTRRRAAIIEKDSAHIASLAVANRK